MGVVQPERTHDLVKFAALSKFTPLRDNNRRDRQRQLFAPPNIAPLLFLLCLDAAAAKPPLFHHSDVSDDAVN